MFVVTHGDTPFRKYKRFKIVKLYLLCSYAATFCVLVIWQFFLLIQFLLGAWC
jgi:hypothetical protein